MNTNLKKRCLGAAYSFYGLIKSCLKQQVFIGESINDSKSFQKQKYSYHFQISVPKEKWILPSVIFYFIQAYAYLLVLIKGNIQPKFEMVGLKNSKWSLICDCGE
jgi:hypothetical protein